MKKIGILLLSLLAALSLVACKGGGKGNGEQSESSSIESSVETSISSEESLSSE